MKTFFEKLIQRIDFLQPANSVQKKETAAKRKAESSIRYAISPDCFAMRSASKKQQHLRRTPAP